MKTKNKENRKRSLQLPLRKHDYYFHADEDFREDREWGKTKSQDLAKNNPSGDKLSLNV